LFNKDLKEKLKIGGMDILIETDGEDIKVVFLELNPRPSGIDKLSPFIKF
jgi:carbamoylphosphate synthase large subunit